MLELIRLYASLLMKPGRRLLVRTSCRVLAVGARGKPFSSRVIQFTDNQKKAIEVVRTLDEIGWTDILLRRVRFLNVPSKEILSGASARRKRKLIKWLGLSLTHECTLCNLRDALFEPRRKKLVFVPSRISAGVLRFHLPDAEVVKLKEETKLPRLWLIGLAVRLNARRCRDFSTGLTVFVNVPVPHLVRAYRRLHPNRRIVIRFHDAIGGSLRGSVSGLRRMIRTLLEEGVIESAESYCRKDAEMLGIAYRPNGANPGVMKAADCPERSFLYAFLGIGKRKGTSSRLQDLEAVTREITALYPGVAPWIGGKLISDGTSADWMDYPDYVRFAAKAEVCVDLYRTSPEEGMSFRIPEALFLNRKIITNRPGVRGEPFYSPERVFIIGTDPLSRLREFLEKDTEPLPPEVLDFYDTTLWWSERPPHFSSFPSRTP